MHLAPIPGSGSASGCTGVTLLAPFLNIVSCLEPVVPLPDLIQGFVEPLQYFTVSRFWKLVGFSPVKSNKLLLAIASTVVLGF
jgi:hypothetical protein